MYYDMYYIHVIYTYICYIYICYMYVTYIIKLFGKENYAQPILHMEK